MNDTPKIPFGYKVVTGQLQKGDGVWDGTRFRKVRRGYPFVGTWEPVAIRKCEVVQTELPVEDRPKRKWCYIMPPAHFDIAPCSCGNQKIQWSEFEKHCWCDLCQKDFIPEYSGIFDGPILSHTAQLIGINFDRLNLENNKVEKWNADKIDWDVADT